MKYVKYVTDLGFSEVKPKTLTKAPRSEVRAFTFKSFSPEKTRATLGKAKSWKPDLFVFVLGREMAVRVDTLKNVVLLGNSRRAVIAFLASTK